MFYDYLSLAWMMMLLGSCRWLASTLSRILMLENHRILPWIHLLRVLSRCCWSVWMLITHNHLGCCNMHLIVLFINLLSWSVTVPASLAANLWLIYKTSIIILRYIIVSLDVILSLHIVLITMHLRLLLIILLLMILFTVSLISTILLIIHLPAWQLVWFFEII